MKSLEELRAIREKMQGKVGVRAENENQTRVVVGMATCGIASGARPVLSTLSDAVQQEGLSKKISVTQTGCIGLCQYEPIVEVMEPGKEKGFCPDRRDIQTGKFLDKPFIDLCSFVKIVITGHSEAAL